jgi:energy-coupling factor transporter ATP-binding protein EcfA2
MLLDEPLSAVDVPTRSRLLEEISSTQHGSGIPFLYVTHNHHEAVHLGNTMLVIEVAVFTTDTRGVRRGTVRPIRRTTSPHAIIPHDLQARIVQACHAWKCDAEFTSIPGHYYSGQGHEWTMNASLTEPPQKRLGPGFGEQRHIRSLNTSQMNIVFTYYFLFIRMRSCYCDIKFLMMR